MYDTGVKVTGVQKNKARTEPKVYHSGVISRKLRMVVKRGFSTKEKHHQAKNSNVSWYPLRFDRELHLEARTSKCDIFSDKEIGKNCAFSAGRRFRQNQALHHVWRTPQGSRILFRFQAMDDC